MPRQVAGVEFQTIIDLVCQDVEDVLGGVADEFDTSTEKFRNFSFGLAGTFEG